MGTLSLRRRRRPMSDVDVYEIKLGDEFLMSSQFTSAEIELARLGLAALGRGDLDVVVGGLGLGYTARAVLENPDVRSLIVVDALAEVIEWHEQGLLPLGRELTADPRCRLVKGDFFAMSSSVEGFDNSSQGRRFDAVLVDIDHSPRKLLHPRHAALEVIARLEGFDRGRYAGAVGWVDGHGNGRFAVSIRCAELDGPRARVVAGNGIVADSDPATELIETRAKLNALLSAIVRP